MHVIVQTLIGANVGVTLWFAFKSTPISVFQLHVGLCVIGYQLLMAHGVLTVRSPGWSLLSLKHRRRVHWILQLSGSILAIAGSAIMIKEKTDGGRPHFTSLHAKFALAALVFTCGSLINGLLSLYVVELRNLIPGNVSKISHIILGIGAFATSSASLAFGFKKHSFVEWATDELANVMISVLTVYTALIIVMPFYNVLRRIGVSRVKIW
ncbi:eukaryotic cytochrome b561 domain-containing protein [Phthorimaea operculella]|nr:eukaryotic cytochrome b561 domain-containing protein [Phthorimaea operculella]